MYPVSEAYKQAIAQNERNVRIVGTITLKDGSVINIEDKDIVQGSLYVTEQCVAGEDIEVGNVYAAEMGLTLNTPPANPYVLDGARIFLQFGIETAEDVWEYVPLGYYYVTEIERKNTAVSIKALDGMVLFDVNLSNIATMGTPYTIISSCCNKVGVTLATSQSAFSSFANGTKTFRLPSGGNVQTCRDVIMWLCQLMGCFARMNRIGQLEIVPIKSGTIVKEITKQQRYSTDVSDFMLKITKIEMTVDETTYSQGADGLTLALETNPFIVGMNDSEINSILANILNQITTAEYTPCNITFIGDPALQAGDWVKMPGVGMTQKEQITAFLTAEYPAEIDIPVVYAFITHNTWRYRGPHELRAVGKSALMRGVRSQQSKKIENTYSVVSSVKTIAEIAREMAEAANQSAQLINEAIMGYILIRVNPSTGANEFLVMDTPDPKQAVKVWRWNMGGLGFSDNVVGVDNPDRQYKVAITMDGAINADFIKTGRLLASVVQIGPGTLFADGYDPTTKETPEGAQQKANAAFSAAAAYADDLIEQLANGQYYGGTFITGNYILSPIIAGSEGRFTGTVKVGSGNDMAGISGEGTGNTSVRFWAGSSIKTSAPFRVLQDGQLIATSAQVSGTLYAEGDMYVGRDLYLYDGYRAVGGAIYFGMADPAGYTPHIHAQKRYSSGIYYYDLALGAVMGNIYLDCIRAYVGSYEIWHKGNDGAGSGMDADLLDGYHASSFALASHTHSNYLSTSGGTVTGNIYIATGVTSGKAVKSTTGHSNPAISSGGVYSSSGAWATWDYADFAGTPYVIAFNYDGYACKARNVTRYSCEMCLAGTATGYVYAIAMGGV